MPEMSREWLAQEIVETTPDAVIFAGVDGVIRLWNASAERMFGYTAAEALGQSLDLIIPERLRARHWDAYHKAMAAGTTKYTTELLAVPATRKDGARISIEFAISLLRDEGGRVLGPAAVVRDVTARRQEQTELRERLSELEARQSASAS